MKRVYATQDDSGHWYVIPYEMKEQFFEWCEDDYEQDEFFIQYMTGGDLNLIELYANI